jgi:hypothetical protein
MWCLGWRNDSLRNVDWVTLIQGCQSKQLNYIDVFTTQKIMGVLLKRGQKGKISQWYASTMGILHKYYVDIWPEQTTNFPLSSLNTEENLWSNGKLNKE